MKNKTLILLILTFLSLNVNAQTDSLHVTKWKQINRIGVELGGSLFPYSIYYKFMKKKNKNHIGFTYKTSIYKFITPLMFSNGLFFNYEFGDKKKFTSLIGAGIYIEPKNLNSNFSFLLSKQKVSYYTQSIQIGYSKKLEKLEIGLTGGINTLYFYKTIDLDYAIYRFKFYPMIGINLSYILKK